MKKICVLFALCYGLTMNGMETETQQSNLVGDQLQRIEKDSEKLSIFLTCFFTQIGEHSNPKERPTTALTFLANSTYPLNERVPLVHMPATEYIQRVILPSTSLDSEFEAKSKELNDHKETWSWFGTYFKKQSFKTIMADYKKSLK